jgi:hypothetical protein
MYKFRSSDFLSVILLPSLDWDIAAWALNTLPVVSFYVLALLM